MGDVAVLSFHDGIGHRDGELLGVFLPGPCGAEVAKGVAWDHARGRGELGISGWWTDPDSDKAWLRFATPLVPLTAGCFYKLRICVVQEERRHRG